MSSRQELEQAIVALEAQRAALGDDVVDMAVAVLREKLASRQGYPLVAQHEQTTVLVADLSGFTALSEWRDAEEVRDTMNAVWQKLDSVIESWEGNIDKHVGDGVIALFGVPDAREDDVERAIRAALDMQMELALFNEQTGQEISQDYFSRTAPPAELRMRIGIHTGPVLFGRVGTGEEHTAIGDTVIMANQLERLAPVGGILISHAVYRQVHALFDVQPLELSLLDGVQEPSRFYVVKRDKPGVFRFTMRGIEGVSDGTLATRLVGRTEELQRLQDALQTTIDSGVAQVMTVAGEAGVGKSRLLYEFERLLALLPEPVCLFKGRVHQVVNASPYGLVRDVFVNYFDIHHRSSAAVAREKLVRGVMDAMEEEGARARERAHFIGHLLGFNFAGSPYLLGIQNEARRIREYGFQDVAHFFKAITKDYPATVLLLEDIHRADEGSFDLIDYLVQECHHVPMLIVCLARPSLFEKRPSWHLVESLDPAMYQHLELQPLSAIDSRHLVADILRHVANVPLKLSDLIVNSAGGNPFYIEELIKVLIEEGVVIKGPERWRVDLGKLTDVPAPAPLATLLQSRLERLTLLERRILERAAVVGRVFWDTLLLQLGQSADVAVAEGTADSTIGRSLSQAQFKRVLRRLEELEWIYQRRVTTFTGTKEYAFRHDSLSEILYDTIPAFRRHRHHAQAAAWFIEHYDQNTSSSVGYASIIARHLERAEDRLQASAWYGRAARQAEISFAPETAIHYYCQALNLLPARASTAAQRVTLNEGLGEMLRWQARFSDAVDAFKAMQVAARAIDDRAAEVRAFLGLFWAYTCQGAHGAALNSASHAETAARAARSHDSLAAALAAKGWALLSLGEVSGAVKAGKGALTMSTVAVVQRVTAYSNVLLGNIGRVSGYYDQAVQHTEKALHLFRELGDRMWEGLMLAQLGRIAQTRGDDATAIMRYRDGLRIARAIGDYYGILLSLRQLGRLAGRQEAYTQAEEQYQLALVFAEKSGNIDYRTAVASDLGELYLVQALSLQVAHDSVGKEGYMQQAYVWFRRALHLAQETDRPLRQATAQRGLARLYLEDEQMDEALRCVREAIGQAERALEAQQGVAAKKELAAAWRVAALVAARQPSRPASLTVDGEVYDSAACFAQSLRLLEEVGPTVAREKAQTLHDWAALGGAVRRPPEQRVALETSDD